MKNNTMENARKLYATGIKIRVINEEDLPNLIKTFDTLFSKRENNGNCLIRIDYMRYGATQSLVLGENYKIVPTNDIILKLKELDCVDNLELIYTS